MAQQPLQDNHFQDPESLVRELYNLVTFEAGQSPDWEKVRSLFIEEAVITLRTSRESMTVFSVDSFVEGNDCLRNYKIEQELKGHSLCPSVPCPARSSRIPIDFKFVGIRVIRGSPINCFNYPSPLTSPAS